jgi:CubicO group peptidase (beta-lactamase class C family)
MGSLMTSTRKRRLALAGVLLGGAALGCGAVGWQAGAVGAGYSAQILCSSVFVSGRSADEVVKHDLTHIPLLSVEVDAEARAVVAHVGPVSRRASYREGLGSVLHVGEADALPPPPVPSRSVVDDALWPGAEAQVPLDREALDAAVAAGFADADPSAPVQTRAVLVVYQDALLAERYAPGVDRGTPLMGWSMTKSVLNALLGALVHRGGLRIEDPAGVPEWAEDERAQISVDELLRMSSGLRFDESYFSPSSDVVQMLFCSGDVAGFAADRPLEHPRGSHWAYASGTSNILSGVLRRRLGGDLQAYWAFPRDALFGPLGMQSAVLETDAQGTFVASSLMYATGRDWARFGLLYLHDGVWNGRRILPEGWVDYTRTPTPHAPKGRYGAHWWLNAGRPDDPTDRPFPRLPTDLYRASGFQGQSVTVVPSRRVVIVRLGCTTPPAEFDYEGFVAGVLQALPGPGKGVGTLPQPAPARRP